MTPSRAAGVRAQLLGLALLGVGVVLGLLVPVARPPLVAAASAFIAALSFLAPYIIFFTLVPALLDLDRRRDGGATRGSRVVGRALLLVLGINATAAALAAALALVAFPPLGRGAATPGAFASLGPAVSKALTSEPLVAVLWSLMSAGLLASLRPWRPARATAEVIEAAGAKGVLLLGSALRRAFPALLLVFGAYLGALAGTGPGTVGAADPLRHFLVSVSLTAVGAAVWIAAATWAVCRRTGWPWRRAASEYLAYLLPFTVATSSTAAALPLNLDRAREGLGVSRAVAGVAVPLGTALSRPGTAIGAVLITLAAAASLGLQVSPTSFLLVLFFAWAIQPAVPGVPGGIGVVGPPLMAAALAVPAAVEPAFLALWFAFLVGVGDSFRTSANAVGAGLLARALEGKVQAPREDAPS